MLKHIGKHGERKVAILYHKIPGEDHMCLVVYSDLLPRMIHDEVMKTIESPQGQQASDLAEALFRVQMADGRNTLEVLHKEGFMKKVQTSQVIMTPTLNSSIRLDELNKILAEMALGEEAVKKLAEYDKNAGLQTKKRDNTQQPVVPPLQAGPNEALSDEAIANQRRAQAAKMRSEAAALIAESERLEAEAAALVPTVPAASVESGVVNEPV